MSKPTTSLGTNELHSRHSVMIEGGLVPRAKVMDQVLIDAYLMRGLLSLKEHRAGEYLLGQAAKANMWAKGANLLGAGGGVKKSTVPMGVFPFGRTLVMVKQRWGPYCAYVVKRVVCDNWDVAEKEYDMACLKRGLSHIADVRMGWSSNPLRYLIKNDLRNPHPNTGCK